MDRNPHCEQESVQPGVKLHDTNTFRGDHMDEEEEGLSDGSFV